MPTLPAIDLKSGVILSPHVVILGAGASAATCPNGDRNGIRLPVMKDFISVVGLEDQGQSLYRNDGGLNFTEVSNAARIGTASVRYLGWGIGCVDLDNDGWHDLFAVNGHVYPQVDALQAGAKYRQRKLIFLNQRDGTFRDVSALVGPALGVPQPSRGAAFGDLDNDGRIDVVVENIDGRPMVLHNDATSSTRWITLELVGTRSNRLAIGAKVKAAVGSLVQMDEVRSGGSYLSQSDLRIHFGLDNAEKVERVEIRWPSGQTEVLQNLPANRFYAIKEGEGITPPERARPALKKAAQKNLPRSLAYMSAPERDRE